MSKGGFDTMSPERLREVSREGGKRVHAMGRAYRLTAEDRAKGGRKRVEQGFGSPEWKPKRKSKKTTMLSAAERTLPLFPELEKAG